MLGIFGLAAQSRPGRAVAAGLAVTLGLAGWGAEVAASELVLAAATAPLVAPHLPPPRPETATAANAAAATTEPASKLAVMRSPRPPEKPESLAKQHARATAHRTTAATGPASVRQAARQHGLSLAGTSLIGVLDARSGRQALIRTSGGDYRKVGRGDSIDGWRVTAVNPDSVRLSRGTESRTLPLIAR